MTRRLLVALALLLVAPSIASAVEIVQAADLSCAAVTGVEPKFRKTVTVSVPAIRRYA